MLVGRGAKKTFDEYIVDDLAGVRAGEFVYSKYFKELRVEVGEG